MTSIISAIDIPVLAKIFQPATTDIFVLTSKLALEYYQTIPDQLGCSVQFFTKEQDLRKAWSALKKNKKVLLNLSEQQLEIYFFLDAESIIIDCSKHNYSIVEQFPFDFIKNADGTIRWIYKNQLGKPTFLNLYNSSGWKGKIIESIFRIGFACRLKRWLKSGSFQVFANQLFLEDINKDLEQANYAIFTGTIGENRKAVISFEEQGIATQFLKLPLTHAAEKLIDTETNSLQNLQQYAFKFLKIPKAKRKEKGVMLTNVKPPKTVKNTALTEVHLSALSELYQYTSAPIILSSTKVWKTINADLELINTSEIVNDLSPQKVSRLYNLLVESVQDFDANELQIMSIAHGDLTPWNSYLSDQELSVYDWELSQNLPLLYDAFHFVFQTGILVERLPYSLIKKKIEGLKQQPIIQTILSEYAMDFDQVYQFYLLRNISYYLPKYMQQPQLHAQVYWQIDTWLESLERKEQLV